MRLPYFPLHVVVFPYLPLPIHVFEERYRLMTQDVVVVRETQTVAEVLEALRSLPEIPDQTDRRHDVVRVIEAFPLALLAGEDEFGVGQHPHQRRELTVAGHVSDFRDSRRRLADGAQRLDLEPVPGEPDRRVERRLGDRDDPVR